MDSRAYTFTVFTPTYNRAHLLPRVYNSLKRQTFTDFEWLVIDDGSTDNTEELIIRWQKEAHFPIRYIKQSHGHKKVAHNRAVREAKGKFFLPFDSDDECVPHALERFIYHWESIPADQRDEFTGITVHCMDENGQIIGDLFPSEKYFDSNSLDIFYQYCIRGEKWGFHRIDVLRKYPFPENIPGYVPESIIWKAIARTYKTRFVNEALRIYHTGHTNRIMTPHSVKPDSAGYYILMEQILNEETHYFRYRPFYFIKIAINWTRLGLHSKLLSWKNFLQKNSLSRILIIITFPIGFILAKSEK
ncbi:MAG: glycosyltransferase family 2 protein [Thermoflavifilum sp.]|uniref:glycosyltransferase family A protein n=1 Tax=Thermoflavifilum sp. TaxID=1968839 RepID=UPI0018A5D851|nr:glycosyltransferase family 2 protein [Thermoflavifilum sp.]QOR75596.1 MAG: glycosyltransferase family 2 protein [Thermoflavifilum sp.]